MKNPFKDPLLFIPGIHLIVVLLLGLLGFFAKSSPNDQEASLLLWMMNMLMASVDLVAFIVILIFQKYRVAFGFLFSCLLVFLVGWGLCFAQAGYRG